jgi:hypothetical protein
LLCWRYLPARLLYNDFAHNILTLSLVIFKIASRLDSSTKIEVFRIMFNKISYSLTRILEMRVQKRLYSMQLSSQNFVRSTTTKAAQPALQKQLLKGDENCFMPMWLLSKASQPFDGSGQHILVLLSVFIILFGQNLWQGFPFYWEIAKFK